MALEGQVGDSVNATFATNLFIPAERKRNLKLCYVTKNKCSHCRYDSNHRSASLIHMYADLSTTGTNGLIFYILNMSKSVAPLLWVKKLWFPGRRFRKPSVIK